MNRREKELATIAKLESIERKLDALLKEVRSEKQGSEGNKEVSGGEEGSESGGDGGA